MVAVDIRQDTPILTKGEDVGQNIPHVNRVPKTTAMSPIDLSIDLILSQTGSRYFQT